MESSSVVVWSLWSERDWKVPINKWPIKNEKKTHTNTHPNDKFVSHRCKHEYKEFLVIAPSPIFATNVRQTVFENHETADWQVNHISPNNYIFLSTVFSFCIFFLSSSFACFTPIIAICVAVRIIVAKISQPNLIDNSCLALLWVCFSHSTPKSRN